MLSKKELFNAKSASNKIEKGMTIELKNVGTYSDTDKDGHPVTVTVLVSVDDIVYTSISKTVADSIDMLDDIISDEGKALIEVISSKSNNGREFFQLKLV